MSTDTPYKSHDRPLPPFTAQHIEEWASFGPPLREKPTSPEQLIALKERKARISEMKQRLVLEFNGDPDCNNGSSTWSARAIERELNRLVSERDDDNQNDSKDRPAYQLDNDHPDNIIDYRADGGPLMQYLWSQENPLQGQTLYLGGEVGADQNIYCIPGHAGRVLQINTVTNTVRQVGPSLTSNGRIYKWLRGIVVGNLIYGLPCHADEILRIDVSTLQVTKMQIPYEQFYSDDSEEAKTQRQMIWKYHGGTICPIDNCIYAIPQAAHHVLKLDPKTEEISFVGPAFPGKCKWYGGVLGKQDGAIYGIPQNAVGVLRIAPNAVTVHGNYGKGNHKWHGAAAAENGVIVSVPANANTVLCITPGEQPILQEIGNEEMIQSGRHRTDGKYKYLGAMCCSGKSGNGKVYIFPCASEYVLQVDTVHFIAKNVGPNLRDANLERVHQNKWQNGLTCVQDQSVYGMPLSGHTLLKIDCSETSMDEHSKDPIVTTWRLPSPRIDCRDKFEGGVMTPSGIMYTVPNNHKGILRIEPANLLD